ncbi:ABC transporter substrate-binding protein [Candidatus Thioglobus sp.]|uniref:ABC transporter substrate-binding protein n=1 Tax=Candidatus Thioglobus sp. TaxID=2026721 RepID=UPI002618E292|nr:ABC transporter substrate-binding protein [Candidatus Thioglobus sp.]MDG2394890.1 ABC transporter substrate-binding protein [Candidatus Thioglobus sp.]
MKKNKRYLLRFYLFLILLNGEKMRRLNVILVAFLLSLSVTSFAQEELVNTQSNNTVSNANANAKVEEVEEVANIVKQKKVAGPVQTIQRAIVKLNQLTTVANYTPQLVGTLVETEVAPLFDFDHIANEILLVSSLQLGAEEKAFFTNKIKHSIVSSLLSKLSQTRSTSFQFISARPIIGGAIALKLKVNGYYSYGMFLDLIFHKAADKQWKIADVVLNNDSLINYYQKMVLIKLRRYGVYGMLGKL